MLTLKLYEKNITLRCLVEESGRNSSYINMALTNTGLTLFQAFIATLAPKTHDKPPQFLINAVIIMGTIVLLLVSLKLTDFFSVKKRFGLPLAKPKDIFEDILVDREVFVENETLLDAYIEELTAIIKVQHNWMQGLFALRSLIAGLILQSENTFTQATLPLNAVDTLVGVGAYAFPSNKIDDVARNLFTKKDDKFLEAFAKIFQNEFEAINIDVIAASSIMPKSKSVETVYLAKLVLDVKRKPEQEIQKILWKIKAIAEPGSRIFQENKKYIAYLNLNMTPYLGWKKNSTVQKEFLDGLSRAFVEANSRIEKVWDFKERWLRLTLQFYFGCEIKHGFDSDMPLDEFAFANVHDINLFENLVSLQKEYPEIVTQKDASFSISLSKSSQRMIDDLQKMMAPKPINLPPPPPPPPPTKDTSQKSFFSWKRWRNTLWSEPVIAALPAAALQPINWEDNAHASESGELVPITNYAQLQPITGSLNYIYYSDEFKTTQDETHRDNVAEQIKTYRDMIAHEDTGNGIKELRDNKNRLTAYYTSDGKSDTRIIFTARTTASVPLESNPTKMKTIILLTPWKVCTHAELNRLALNHPALQASAVILSRKQNPTSASSSSSALQNKK